MLVPLSEAKTRLFELVRDAEDEDIVLLRHGRPAAVIVGAARLDALVEELEDVRDRLSVYESREAPEDLRVPLDKAKAELGLTS
jgi:antitoxin StbD